MVLKMMAMSILTGLQRFKKKVSSKLLEVLAGENIFNLFLVLGFHQPRRCFVKKYETKV